MKSLRITPSITDRQDASLRLYFKDVSKLPMISQEKEIELAQKAKNGDGKAIQELVKANLRFVISVAKQYQGKGLPLVDLIQEGSLGIIQAAKLFNPDRGIKFISYAVWWIRQSIIKAISDQCRTIRTPLNQIVCLRKISKATERFEQEHGIKPSSEELEQDINIEVDKINSTLAYNNKTISLDNQFNDTDGCLLDIIPNNNAVLADTYIDKTDLINEIEYILSELSPRDSDVLRMSFGIGIHPMQNEEIANRFGIGTERVRQIQHNAIKYIRKHYLNELKDLL